jgi:hypothetical protein
MITTELELFDTRFCALTPTAFVSPDVAPVTLLFDTEVVPPIALFAVEPCAALTPVWPADDPTSSTNVELVFAAEVVPVPRPAMTTDCWLFITTDWACTPTAPMLPLVLPEVVLLLEQATEPGALAMGPLTGVPPLAVPKQTVSAETAVAVALAAAVPAPPAAAVTDTDATAWPAAGDTMAVPGAGDALPEPAPVAPEADGEGTAWGVGEIPASASAVATASGTGVRVAVGGSAVAVGGTAVAVGGSAVAVGGADVPVAGTAVGGAAVAPTATAVGATAVGGAGGAGVGGTAAGPGGGAVGGASGCDGAGGCAGPAGTGGASGCDGAGGCAGPAGTGGCAGPDPCAYAMAGPVSGAVTIASASRTAEIVRIPRLRRRTVATAAWMSGAPTNRTVLKASR